VHLFRNSEIKLVAIVAIAIAMPPLTGDAAGPKKDWVTLENCELIPNPDNDGDSFHIRSNGTEYLVRLYLVDAPETKGGQMAGRLIEQATYFGLSVPDVVQLGQNAKLFVENKLSQRFTVETRKASGLGRSNIERFYAFVQTKDGDLGELLVANGLARVHGTKAARPGAKSSTEEVEKLQQLEQQAKQTKLGGWSGKVGTTVTASQPARTTVPSPIVQSSARPIIPNATPIRQSVPSATISSASSQSAAVGKLDINTATKEQLEKIPGIGDALADRIIAGRPFQTADDLKKVKGFGNGKKYEEVRPYFK
jgi:DNA uptake protein ComE-like DNA-binding protein